MSFSHSIYLWFIPIIVPLIIFFQYRNQLKFNYPSLDGLPIKKHPLILTDILYYFPVVLISIALIFFLIALANPRQILTNETQNVEGISIMLAFDLSESMNAEDFKPKNRFVVAQSVLNDFISRRKDDLLGVVVFGTDAYLLSPLTIDYRLLQSQISALELGQIDGSTAIGNAIVKSINHIRDSKTKTKIIILLTDGMNTAGDIDPIKAVNLAAALGIKIYAVGVGKPGGAPIPYQHPYLGKQYYQNPDGSLYLTELDEKTLKEIARITDGSYFRATDSETLSNIYETIDQLEKTKIESKKILNYKSKYMIYLLIGIVFYVLYFIVEFAVLRISR
ncbi:MAG: hypothetical protein A2Y40_07455 [Candidatus Margulisbacteria bacterium GWF2_35_9]|nr:MAG: hypothetical protein A2Y40_07455 [Candidatus Margulisbacteria bacterium GWF2_35_9]